METKTLVLLLAPLVVAELGMKIYALVDLYRRPKTRGPKAAWAAAIVLVSTFGWVAYLLAGRQES